MITRMTSRKLRSIKTVDLVKRQWQQYFNFFNSGLWTRFSSILYYCEFRCPLGKFYALSFSQFTTNWSEGSVLLRDWIFTPINGCCLRYFDAFWLNLLVFKATFNCNWAVKCYVVVFYMPKRNQNHINRLPYNVFIVNKSTGKQSSVNLRAIRTIRHETTHMWQ